MTPHTIPRILAVGSLPPPLGGTSVSFQVLCDEVRRHAGAVALDVVDAAPRLIKEDARVLRLANLEQAFRTLWPFLRKIRKADLVLVVGSHVFLFTMGAAILLVSRLSGRRCYFRSFGYLDSWYESLSPGGRWLFRRTVRGLDGLFVETRLVQLQLTKILNGAIHWVPGYRDMPAAQNGGPPSVLGAHDTLRLVYLSQVREEKGIFVLLESLQHARIRDRKSIHCDIYGPVFPSVAARFDAELRRTPNATYKGQVRPEDAVATLRQYDAFVFPTHWPGEGHAGVLMEAMMAGVSVIATRHRSVPELVEDRVNGLLVEPRNADELAEAIGLLDADRQLLRDTATRNWERRTHHAATTVVPAILDLMGVHVTRHEERTAETSG